MPSRASRISSGRMLNSVTACSSAGGSSCPARAGARVTGQFAAGLVEVAGDACVDDLVADSDREPADQGGVDDHLQADVMLEGPAERSNEVALLVVVQLDSRGDVGDQPVSTLGSKG